MTVIHIGATMINAEATIKHDKDVDTLKLLCGQLLSERNEMRDAMQEVVDRVERGQIRSVKTYAKFNLILAKASGEI